MFIYYFFLDHTNEPYTLSYFFLFWDFFSYPNGLRGTKIKGSHNFNTESTSPASSPYFYLESFKFLLEDDPIVERRDARNETLDWLQFLRSFYFYFLFLVSNVCLISNWPWYPKAYNCIIFSKFSTCQKKKKVISNPSPATLTFWNSAIKNNAWCGLRWLVSK